jgi:hypothetical protein
LHSLPSGHSAFVRQSCADPLEPQRLVPHLEVARLFSIEAQQSAPPPQSAASSQWIPEAPMLEQITASGRQ